MLLFLFFFLFLVRCQVSSQMDATKENFWKVEMNKIGNFLLGEHPKRGTFMFAVLVEPDERCQVRWMRTKRTKGFDVYTFAHGKIGTELLLCIVRDSMKRLILSEVKRQPFWKFW